MFRLLRKSGPSVRRSDLISVVSAAAVSKKDTSTRIFPVVVLDASNRPDIVDLFRLHDKVPPGDVRSTWITLYDFPDHLALRLEFLKPMTTEAVINFDLVRFGAAVDLAIQSRCIFLQAGKPGDRVVDNGDRSEIIAEIGAEISQPHWEGLWQKAVTKELKSNGVPRSNRKRVAVEYVSRMRAATRSMLGEPPGVYSIGPKFDLTRAEGGSH